MSDGQKPPTKFNFSQKPLSPQPPKTNISRKLAQQNLIVNKRKKREYERKPINGFEIFAALIIAIFWLGVAYTAWIVLVVGFAFASCVLR
jgi:hypothetical protein